MFLDRTACPEAIGSEHTVAPHGMASKSITSCLKRRRLTQPARTSSSELHVVRESMELEDLNMPRCQTIVKPTALESAVVNTDIKLLIDSLFQKGRVLAQDGESTQVWELLIRVTETDRRLRATMSRAPGSENLRKAQDSFDALRNHISRYPTIGAAGSGISRLPLSRQNPNP